MAHDSGVTKNNAEHGQVTGVRSVGDSCQR